MKLSNNLISRALTGREQLSAFVNNLSQQISANDNVLNGLMGLAQVSAEFTAASEVGDDPYQAATAVWNEIKEDYPLSSFCANSDLGHIINVAVTSSEQIDQNITIYEIDENDGTTVLNYTTLLNVANGAVTEVADLTNLSFPISQSENITLAGIIEQCQNSTTGMKIMEAAGQLYIQGNLDINSLYTKLSTSLDVTKDDVKSYLDIIIREFSTITASYTSFIEFSKSLFNKVRNISGSGGSFTYGVDQYQVNTSCFIAIDVVFDVVTQIVNTVLLIFAPIVGVITSIVGSAAKKIREAISENTSNTCLMPDDPSFEGFGQNIFRTYVPDTSHVIYESMSTLGYGIACIHTPLTTILVYNNPKKNGLNQDVYPVQEFIIPFIPLKESVCNRIFDMIANGNVLQTSTSSVQHGDWDYCTLSVSIAAQSKASSQERRFDKYLSLLSDINSDPDSIHYCDNGDSDFTIKMGTWISTLVYLYATRSLSEEYSGLSFLYDSYLALSNLNINGVSARSDVLSKSYFLQFMGWIKMLGLILHDYQYNPEGTASITSWIDGILHQDPGGQPYRMWHFDECNIAWDKIVNAILGTDLAIASLTGYLQTEAYYEVIPYLITSVDMSDPLNPSIIPPAAKFSIWARIAITLGVVAAAAVAIAVTVVVVRKKAQKSFYKNAAATRTAYENWQKNPTKANWKAYKKLNTKTKLIGKVFGFGSFDAQNNWINRPEASQGAIMSQLSNLSGGTDGEIDTTLGDVTGDLGSLSTDIGSVKRLIQYTP